MRKADGEALEAGDCMHERHVPLAVGSLEVVAVGGVEVLDGDLVHRSRISSLAGSLCRIHPIIGRSGNTRPRPPVAGFDEANAVASAPAVTYPYSAPSTTVNVLS